MRCRVPLALVLLPALACARGPCAAPLAARPGSDTARALAVATDTISRHWPAPRRGQRGWIAETIARGGADTLVVEVGPRCWQGPDASSATVRIVPPGRVVAVEEHLGG